MEEKIIKERIEENEELFTEDELEIVEENFSVIKKVYLIGLINAKEIYTNIVQEN